MYDFPSRGVQTIGYAALKTGGFKSSGMITGEDIGLLAQKHPEIVSKLCTDRGVPREKVFANAGGAETDLEACLHGYACTGTIVRRVGRECVGICRSRWWLYH